MLFYPTHKLCDCSVCFQIGSELRKRRAALRQNKPFARCKPDFVGIYPCIFGKCKFKYISHNAGLQSRSIAVETHKQRAVAKQF